MDRKDILRQHVDKIATLWSGQNTMSLKHHKAGELMNTLIEETGKLLNA